jgi:hypothetical protein
MQPSTVATTYHDIKALDDEVGALIAGIQTLARIDDLEELRVKVFPRPGWTTPVEFLLVHAALGALRTQVEAATVLKQRVVEASRRIALLSRRQQIVFHRSFSPRSSP